jgi:hypothetical protein
MNGRDPDRYYLQLATLARYEHAKVSSDNPQYLAAMAQAGKRRSGARPGRFHFD